MWQALGAQEYWFVGLELVLLVSSAPSSYMCCSDSDYLPGINTDSSVRAWPSLPLEYTVTYFPWSGLIYLSLSLELMTLKLSWKMNFLT